MNPARFQPCPSGPLDKISDKVSDEGVPMSTQKMSKLQGQAGRLPYFPPSRSRTSMASMPAERMAAMPRSVSS